MPVAEVEKVRAADPNWMVSGKWGVIQVVPKAGTATRTQAAAPEVSPTLLQKQYFDTRNFWDHIFFLSSNRSFITMFRITG